MVVMTGLCGCNDQRGATHPIDEDKQETKDLLLPNLAVAISQKVVRIEALDGNGQQARTGTGFFVSSDGKVATCAHIVRDAKVIRVTTLSGAEFQFDRILRVDADRDLALISLKSAVVSPFRLSDTSTVASGLPVVALGNPLGLDGSFADGVISAVRLVGPNEDQIFQISVPVSPGSSGSPVVGLDGSLVGMVGSRAHGGESIGFALPAEYIWEALAEAVEDIPSQSPHKIALTQARKRYMAGDDLANDEEWNHGFIRGVAPLRLAVLERLRSKYPGEAMLTVEIVRNLKSEHKHERAFEECVRLLEKDPGNRLVADELAGVLAMRTKGTQIEAAIEAAVEADPLNWRARQFLFEQERRENEYLSAMMSARTTHLTVPFSLEIAEDYVSNILYHYLDELSEGRSIGSAGAGLLLQNIEATSLLRERIGKAAQVLVNQDEKTLRNFLVVANEHPVTCFPYAWELLFIGINRQQEFGEIRNGSSWNNLHEVVKAAIEKEPTIAEAYFLDPAAINLEESLLLDSAQRVENDLSYSLGIEIPFDFVAIVFLLADSVSDSPIFTPQSVSQWALALDNYERSLKAFSGSYPEFPKKLPIFIRGTQSWREPQVFKFWLALQKEQFAQALSEPALEEDEKNEIRKLLEQLKDIPSKKKVAEKVRALDRKHPDWSLWGYFGGKYESWIQNVLEESAK